jgi:glycerol uptake operon antiterminator
MKTDFRQMFGGNVIIPSIKDDDGLERALKSDQKVVFVLYGDLMTIEEIIYKLKRKGKIVFVNIDLLVGFSSKEVVLPYLKKHSDIDGILSSKAFMVREAKKHDLIAIHRFFLIDSFSYDNMYKQIKSSKPDMVEILPGWARPISWMVKKVEIPIITGGLVCQEDMVKLAIDAGAIAVSTTNTKLW